MNTDSNTIPCWIFRSNREDEMYIYLSREDGFEDIPEALQRLFGEPVPVMQLDLSEERRLAREDVVQVMDNLRTQGFHLQMPPPRDHRTLDS